MAASIIYQGDLRTEATHMASGSTICTDAPKDNQGKGECFSPTDLLATALGTCMLTVMGIKARDMQVDMKGTRCEVEKIMYAAPRRVGALHVVIRFPATMHIDEKTKTILERTAHTCPVAKSLDPAIALDVTFVDAAH